MLLRNADAVPRVDPLFRDRVLVRAAFAGDLWGTTTFLNDVFDGRLLHVRQHGSNFENWQAQKFGLDYGYCAGVGNCSLPLMKWWQRLQIVMEIKGIDEKALAQTTKIASAARIAPRIKILNIEPPHADRAS